MLEMGRIGASSRNVPGRKLRISWVAALRPLRRDGVDLRQGHDAVLDAQQREDVQVLAGLRHDAVVGRHDEDARRPCRVAPATIVLMKFSWPGTSTMPTSMSAITHGAKPSSIDMPRSFSP